uniref:Uncharacterized protein n=1 Tax=Acrobeloides nanus TaxID=290746 RepID=A0A914CY55_9BILA
MLSGDFRPSLRTLDFRILEPTSLAELKEIDRKQSQNGRNFGWKRAKRRLVTAAPEPFPSTSG